MRFSIVKASIALKRLSTEIGMLKTMLVRAQMEARNTAEKSSVILESTMSIMNRTLLEI